MSSEPLAMQPPDSWENSDLDECLKSLSINVTSSGKPLPSGLEANSSIDAFDDSSSASDTRIANGDALSSRQVSGSQIQGAGLSQKALEQVDNFLLEALQNPRDRITVLRFEKDVERFMRNPSAQVLEFEPMGSSYIRLAAHRVAQHYFLQSQAVDVTIPERSRIIARKTPESRFPTIRLVDIPVNLEESPSPAVNPPSQVVMLKQRPGGSRQGERASNSASSQLNTQKTVEERNEEYKRARARIFNNGVEEDDSSGENAVQNTEELSQSNSKSESQKTGSESSSHKKYSDKTSVSVSSQTEFADDPNHLSSNEKLREGDESVPAGKPSSAHSERSNAGRRPCVAIIRDRELDKMDPDYNRNYDRYAQRFDPGFGMQMPNPYGVHGLYAPVMNYNTEFPSLGPGSRPQQHSAILGNVRLEPSPHGVHPYSVQQGLWPRNIRPMPNQYNSDQAVSYNYSNNQMSGQMLHHLSVQMGNSTSHQMLNLIGNQGGNQAANVTGSQAVHLSSGQRGTQSGHQMVGNQFVNPSAMRSSAINPSVYYQHYGINNGAHFDSTHLQSSASAYSPYPTSERFRTSTIPNDIQSNPPASASRRN